MTHPLAIRIHDEVEQLLAELLAEAIAPTPRARAELIAMARRPSACSSAGGHVFIAGQGDPFCWHCRNSAKG